MTPSTIAVVVNGQRRDLTVPAEWSGDVTVTIHVYRGRASRKLLVGRVTSVMVESQRGHEIPP